MAAARSKALTTSELSILAFAVHMAATARSDTARRLFESFVEQERRRLSANGACRQSGVGTANPTAANRALNTSG